MRMVECNDKIIFHPAYYMDEILCEVGMSTMEFATKMDMKIQEANRLLNGELRVSHDLAKKLEMLFGMSAKMWENLQSKYDKETKCLK